MRLAGRVIALRGDKIKGKQYTYRYKVVGKVDKWEKAKAIWDSLTAEQQSYCSIFNMRLCSWRSHELYLCWPYGEPHNKFGEEPSNSEYVPEHYGCLLYKDELLKAIENNKKWK